MRLDRWLAASYAKITAVTLAAVVVLAVLVDFAERSWAGAGEGWIRASALFYLNLSAEIAYQMAPGVLLLSAGIAISALRKQGELTALFSVGVRPARLAASILLTCALAVVGLVALNEWVVVPAGARAREIRRELRATDLPSYLLPKQWFRGQSYLYQLRQTEGEGFADVTLYELGPRFELRRRIDAARMTPAEGSIWRLQDARVFSFDGDAPVLTREPVLLLPLKERPEDFTLVPGRAQLLSVFTLLKQIESRRRLGRDVAELQVELHRRLAYPVAALPGALLAIFLALRPGRRGHLTVSLVEGVGVSLVLWAMLVIFRAAGVAGAVSPVVAGWAPIVAVTALGLAAFAGARLRAKRAVPA